MVVIIIASFFGYELPKYITHTNLVLLPKKEMISKFTNLRPTSLSAYVNKAIYKVIHMRLVSVLLDVILKN